MKRALLFAAIATSMNVSAQELPSDTLRHLLMPCFFENVRIGTKGEKVPGIYPHELGSKIHHQIPAHLTSIQLNDSIYTWKWGKIFGWYIDSKIVNISYDANHNKLSEVYQESLSCDHWGNLNQYFYNYDANNNLTNDLHQRWYDDAWHNTSQYTYTYDANDFLITELEQSWDSSGWENRNKYIYTYDDNHNLINLLGLWRMGDSDNTWYNFYQNIYTYDVNNNLTNDLHQHWEDNAWFNAYQKTYTYNASNKLINESKQMWDGRALENIYLFIHTYDVNNNLTSLSYLRWDGSAWFNTLKTIYTYDANNTLISHLKQLYKDGSDLLNYSQTNYTYDANNNQTGEFVKSWDVSAWVNFSISNKTYDTHNFLQNSVTKYFDNTGTVIPTSYYPLMHLDTDSTIYYFHTIADLNEFKAEEGQFNVFPNPSSGMFTISSNNTYSSIEIYNLLGVRVYSDPQFNHQTSNEIDLSDQGKGIYIINIYDGKLRYNRKIVIQ